MASGLMNNGPGRIRASTRGAGVSAKVMRLVSSTHGPSLHFATIFVRRSGRVVGSSKTSISARSGRT